NFWEGHRYSLPEAELTQFQNEVVLNAADLFPGWTARSRDFFEGLAAQLLKDMQTEYLGKLKELNVCQQAFGSARTVLGSADSLYRAFLLFAEAKGEKVEGRFTLDALPMLNLS